MTLTRGFSDGMMVFRLLLFRYTLATASISLSLLSLHLFSALGAGKFKKANTTL